MIPDNSLQWYEVVNATTLASPALLIYRDRLQYNLRRMVEIAGRPQRLRPHIKTHKMRRIVELQLELGITRFKCATLSEAAMAAAAGAPDVLFAYQPVGPAASRLAELVHAFPKTRFSTLGDDAAAIGQLSRAFSAFFGDEKGQPANMIEVLVDLDLGQHRTGVPPGRQAADLYQLIVTSPHLRPGGLHAYDGHIGDTDLTQRTSSCEAAFKPVASLRRDLEAAGLPVPRVVAGGSPTFPIHARRGDVECSPGTCVFWDAGYLHKLPDLDFKPAAVILTRVVSKPGLNRLCLDLGHKAIASEMPQPRAEFLNLKDAQPLVHSEEHFVVESSSADEFKVGDPVYAVPWHVCPTVALHSYATIIEGAQARESWSVDARDRLAASWKS